MACHSKGKVLLKWRQRSFLSIHTYEFQFETNVVWWLISLHRIVITIKPVKFVNFNGNNPKETTSVIIITIVITVIVVFPFETQVVLLRQNMTYLTTVTSKYLFKLESTLFGYKFHL